MAAFHLLFFLFLALSVSRSSAVAAADDGLPLRQPEVCKASSSSSCTDAVDGEPLNEETSVMFKEKASVFLRHNDRNIKVDFVLPASNSEVAAADAALQLRQEAMAQAITVLSRHTPETTDAATLKRALGVVNLEAQRWKPIFSAYNRVMDSDADDRSKEEALAEARMLLNRELGQEGPNALKLDFDYV